LQRIAYLKAAIDIHKDLGHDYRTYYTLVTLASVYLTLGQYHQVEEWLRPIVNNQVVLDEPDLRYQIINNLSLAAARQRRKEEAQSLAQQMVAMHSDVSRTQHALGYMALGDACLVGDVSAQALADAQTAFIQAFNRRHIQANVGLEIAARTGLAEVAYRQEQHTGHIDAMNTALAEVEWLYAHLNAKIQDPYGRDPFWPHWVCYQVLRIDGDARADALLAKSHDLLQAWAKDLTDESLRVSFLENVQVNRVIIAEVEKWNQLN
ncbi:MAG: hypothetical protein AAF639_26760, partial [Chloroflexota bacterium]